MSYQVLARKWRPHNFSQVVGQQHVLTALSNGLTQNRVHHAYLFSGTRGVGKTTIARILAKSLNCEQGVTATPCGKCENCVAIDQGRFVDLLEIDAASRTKVDDTRELLDNVQYKPAVGRYKVYLIDEVHMLSKHSFNALLKTLEEPPEYVKFLLATTDPQKLPITVLSRCLQFHLKAILPDQIEAQLAHILKHEDATFEYTALNVIAKAADGSMRDALSLTDQALAFGAGNIEYQSVLKMLGTLDNSHLHYLLHFIASGNVAKVFQKIEEFVVLGADFAKLHQELAGLCHQIALQQLQRPQANSEKSAIQLLSERLSPEEVQLYYQIALEGYKDYRFAPNGKVALEMTVMRLLAFKPANYIELDEKALVNNTLVNTTVQSEGNIDLPSFNPAPESIQPAALIETTPVVEQVSVIGNDSSPSLPETRLPEPAPVTVVETLTAQEMPVPTPVIETSPVQDVSSQPMPNQQAPSQQAVIETPPVQEAPANSPAVEVAAPITEAVPVPVKSEPVLESSNSRNMLRSHRLKRNETKKSQATTDHVISTPVVAALPKVDNIIPDVAAKKTDLPITPVIQTDNVTSAPNRQNFSPELPPIEQYQESEQADNRFDSQFDSPYDQFENNSYDPYSPPEEMQSVNTQVAALPSVSNNVQAPVIDNSALNTGIVTKHASFSDQHFEAVEIDKAKYVEDKLTDSWSLAIQTMQVRGLVKLLAKNSVMKKVDDQIVLTLKAEHQHLLNNSGLCEELQMQLKSFYGAQYNMYIEVGNVEGQLTAFESEMALYEQYLNNAKHAIVDDENIKALVANCGAKVYENSVIPL
ncbi:DNA polymerase III subunit gamma/tau [Psychromonas sp. Urea-02u-13]|uniref:DNA polymerase III subunit gamma/tau n=1 Tax=Psychromonas sp. Urea-02u-13 TaxID=2058326 RepID=UPI000C347A60|nr:DNA polymerase III subunit gamma/tau [Psychromonas sp. Urea-02u-13]PKG37597.1 DNA polymerase III subunit gamma/tau [Psychromonas sp. Urea-02u-13]